MHSKKKKIIMILIILSLVFSLIPAVRHYKDGGTVEYKAVLYQVIRWHSMNNHLNISSDQTYFYHGLEVKILGITVYNNAEILETGYFE